MGVNERFFTKNEISIADVISVSQAKPSIDLDLDLIVGGINTLSDAGQGDLSFFHNNKFIQDLKNTKASFVFCSPKDVSSIPDSAIAFIHDNPYFAYSLIGDKMYSPIINYSIQKAHIGSGCNISSKSTIGENVIIGDSCIIEDGVIIKNGAVLGNGVQIKSGSIVGYGCSIGDGSIIDYSVVIEFANIGKKCHICSGVKIGQRGYGFAVDPVKMQIIDVPQYGGVSIGDMVDIGANTTIDRGAINDTKIGSYTKIDNLVQIAHNVEIGNACFIVSQVGIAGGVKIGDLTTLAGQVGVAGHIKIGSQVTVAAQSGVHSGIPDGAKYAGSPAVDASIWRRAMAKMHIDASRKKKKDN